MNFLLNFIFFYFLFYVLYYLFFSLCSRLIKRTKFKTSDKIGSFAVLIPAYKEDQIIFDTAKRNLEQSYPSDKFRIIVIADSLQKETLDSLDKIDVTTVKVKFEKSSKAKAINAVIKDLNDDFDFVIILDADNVMASNCLTLMNDYLQSGHIAIQGHRTAKNRNNSLAVLDSISEEINNSIFRKGPVNVGLSSSLIGSGMAFEYNFYKKIIKNVEDIWEDRELEFRILKRGIKIEYLENALIFDEKVTDKNVIKNQRSKWIAGQIHYFKKYIFSTWKFVLKGNVDLLNKIIQTISPPRALMLGGLFILLTLSFIINLSIPFIFWAMLFTLYIVSLFIAIPPNLVNKQLWKASLHLPITIILMFLGLFKSIFSKNVNFNTPHVEK